MRQRILFLIVAFSTALTAPADAVNVPPNCPFCCKPDPNDPNKCIPDPSKNGQPIPGKKCKICDPAGSGSEVDDPQCPECDNPHALTDSIWECFHLPGDQTCSTVTVILDVISTMTCDHRAAGTGSMCNLKQDPNSVGEVQQYVILSDTGCQGGSVPNTAFNPWTVWYDACDPHSCKSDPYTAYCKTTSKNGTIIAQGAKGIKKVGCP